MISFSNIIYDAEQMPASSTYKLKDIATDHTAVFVILIIAITLLITATIALYVAYKWGKKTRAILNNERLNYKKNFYFTQSVINAIPDELYRINKDGDIIPILELPEEVEKQTKEYTYIGENIYQKWHYEFARKISEAIKQVIGTKTATEFNFGYMQNNATIWHNVQMTPFGNDEALATIRDITESCHTKSKQEESEFLFQSQFEYGLNGVGILNQNLKWITVNKRLSEILGYTTAELLELTWQKIIIPEDEDYDHYIFEKAKQKNGLILEAEKRFINKSGEIVHIYCTIIQYIDEIHNLKQYVVTFQDISFRKEHERTILNAIIKTEEKERTNFAQEIHDGVGPILSSIKMYIQWLQNPNTKADKEQILKDCETLIDDAHETIREVSFNLSPHVLKNFGLVASLQTFTKRLKDASNMNIEFETDNPKQRFAESVEVVLYRAVTECINNTIKYANAKNIFISLKNIDKSIELYYNDDGVGFNAPEVLGLAKGTGLYNIQNRIKSIDGECHFLGAKGSGTKILFKIAIK